MWHRFDLFKEWFDSEFGERIDTSLYAKDKAGNKGHLA